LVLESGKGESADFSNPQGSEMANSASECTPLQTHIPKVRQPARNRAVGLKHWQFSAHHHAQIESAEKCTFTSNGYRYLFSKTNRPER